MAVVAACVALVCAGTVAASGASYSSARRSRDPRYFVDGVSRQCAQHRGIDRALLGQPCATGVDVARPQWPDLWRAAGLRRRRVRGDRRTTSSTRSRRRPGGSSGVGTSRVPCRRRSCPVGISGRWSASPARRSLIPSRSEIFVVADELVGGGPEHYLVGLSTTNGKVELRVHVDPPGSTPDALLQRTGLNLDHGSVVFAMGGNYGDCAAYRGRVISVGETGSPRRIFTVDAAAGDSQGAIWMGGAAPVVDAQGNVWVSTRQRFRQLTRPAVRRQRRHPRTFVHPSPQAVLRAHRLDDEQRRGPRHDGRADTPE